MLTGKTAIAKNQESKANMSGRGTIREGKGTIRAGQDFQCRLMRYQILK